MTAQASAKSGFFSKKTLASVAIFVLGTVLYIGAKSAFVGMTAPERPKVDVNASISGPKRASFVQTFNATCVKTQRAAAANKSVPEATIVAYCGCWSDAVANETTNLELLTNAGILSVAQQERNERLARACKAKS